MMKRKRTVRSSAAFRAAMIILALVIVTLFAVIGSTWASYPANHTLTYTTNKLAWDSRTDVLEDGSGELTLFSTSYKDVNSEDDDKVIAPGTSGSDSIVLRNTVDRTITYTAIAYYITNDLRIPVTVSFDGTNLSDTTDYTLPRGIKKSSVLRVVSGKVASNSEQDFTFNWSWVFETDGLTSDPTDTVLGNDAADGKDEEIKVGFYIVVSDNGISEKTNDDPDNPNSNPDNPNSNPDNGSGKGTGTTTTVTPVKTGDSSPIELYAALVAASFLVMILLLFTGRRKDREEQDT